MNIDKVHKHLNQEINRLKKIIKNTHKQQQLLTVNSPFIAAITRT